MASLSVISIAIPGNIRHGPGDPRPAGLARIIYRAWTRQTCALGEKDADQAGILLTPNQIERPPDLS